MEERNLGWQKLSQERIWDGYRKLDKCYFQLPTNIQCDYEIKIEDPAVCVLALTPDNKVIISKQFRPGPMKVLLELPGGGIFRNEDPMDAIKREMIEETGYTGDFIFIGNSFYDAYSTHIKYNFVATNCQQTQQPKNEDREPVEPVLLDLEDFRKHLQSGQLTDIATGYLGLDYLGLL